MSLDATHMRRALALAERGRGLTSPNPMVGAVLVDRAGEVVGEGFHRVAGGPHAEVEVLAAAGLRARGATLYVTLEPCRHQGRTPPCVPALLAAGVARVVAALEDPDPRVAGGGGRSLRAGGVDVTVGVLAAEAERQNRVFLGAVRRGRPHVTLKAGMSLDGKLADFRGASRWITGEAARRRAHELRAEADAIVVGVGTVLQDDPELTVRLTPAWPREPLRVVLDSGARTPPDARVIGARSPARALIAVGEDVPDERAEKLAGTGATVVRCRLRDGRIDLHSLLAELGSRAVRGILVEGGAEVHAGFVEGGLVDRVAVFVAPMLLGGRGAPGLLGGGGLELPFALRLGAFEVTTHGPDLLLEADVVSTARDSGPNVGTRRPGEGSPTVNP